jgi:branched-chain amino acid transport system ATP-binding protein
VTAATVVEAPALELIDVHAAYGRIEVLHGVDLKVPRGCVVALLGPNGAGKSTALRVASGQMRPTSGHVHLSGHHLNGADADRLARAGLCTIPEGRGVFPNLSVEENLRLFAYTARVGDSEIRERTFSQFPRLKERRGQLAGRLSGGEQQMLAVARALMSRPRLLLLDEPSLGLAPMIVQNVFKNLQSIREEFGTTMLVVEQNANLALGIADRGYVIEAGRIVLSGTADELSSDDAVRAAYLGY